MIDLIQCRLLAAKISKQVKIPCAALCYLADFVLPDNTNINVYSEVIFPKHFLEITCSQRVRKATQSFLYTFKGI